MAECECYATISQKDPRAELWRKIVPDLRVPLKHPLPVNMDGQNGAMRFYEGNPQRLSADQWLKLAMEMNRNFGIPVKEIMNDLKAGRLPIKAEGCTIFWCPLHSRMVH